MWEIPEVAAAQDGHALSLQAKLLARLSAFRNAQLRLSAIERRDGDVAAERGGDHRNRHAAEEIGAVALIEGVRFHRQEEVKIARGRAANARIALPREPDPRAVFDARRDVHGERAFPRHASHAGASAARIVDRLPPSMTARTSALDREKALRRAHAAMAVAGGTGARLRSLLGAGPGAFLAQHGGRHIEFRRLPLEGLLERDLEIGAAIGAAFAPLAATALPRVAEEGIENIRHEVGEVGPEARPAGAVSLRESLVSETIIGGALLAVGEDLISFVDLLETKLRIDGRPGCGRGGAASRACENSPSAPPRSRCARHRALHNSRVWTSSASPRLLPLSPHFDLVSMPRPPSGGFRSNSGTLERCPKGEMGIVVNRSAAVEDVESRGKTAGAARQAASGSAGHPRAEPRRKPDEASNAPSCAGPTEDGPATLDRRRDGRRPLIVRGPQHLDSARSEGRS